MLSMTFIAVVSDYLLHPFYPQFFAERFGVTHPTAVGNYFAALCAVVMVAFPFWAWVSKRVAELHLLIGTQAIAGLLALFCYQTESYHTFWTAALVMVFFKGGYLLIYPYTLKLEPVERHERLIGTLAALVPLGGILGAVLGGAMLTYVTPASAFLIMAGGDGLMMLLSYYLLRSTKFDTRRLTDPTPASDRAATPWSFILRLGLITGLVYFSDFLTRPFFARYWESISVYDSEIVSGAVYAIPALLALLALIYNARYPSKQTTARALLGALLLAVAGMALQSIQLPVAVILGRAFYGWALFQGRVLLVLLLVEGSSLENYSTDYSKIHFFENLGVLLASFATGWLVDTWGISIPFPAALVGLLVSMGLLILLFLVRKGQSGSDRFSSLRKTGPAPAPASNSPTIEIP